jgi:multidrug efflux pump subunit AcrA (membrane-fusion protein)
MRRILGSGTGFILIGIAVLTGCGKKNETSEPLSAPPVVVNAPETNQAPPKAGPIFGDEIATLEGSVATPVQAPVQGYLIKQAYEVGAVVKPGDLLFVIDPKASPDHTMSSARVISPVAGVAGRAIPGPGDFIPQGTTLTTVATVDPIEAEFTLADSAYHDNAERIAKMLALPMEQRAEIFEVITADGKVYPGRGRLLEVSRETETPPNAMTVRLLFPNGDRALRPGQYVQVREVTP